MEELTAANQNLIDRLPKVKGSYRSNVNLARINWFNVGGIADIVFRPEDDQDLAFFLNNKPKDIPVTIIGVGSNLLVRDGGIRGVTIRLGRGFTKIEKANNTIIVGAGALDFNVALSAKEFSLGGLEFLSGIPGTIGGALAMNAGAYGSDISSILIEATAIDQEGTIHKLSRKDIGYIYRGHTLPDNMIFTKAILQGQTTRKELIAERMRDIASKREATQPIMTRTSGSTFKNPPGKKAWELLELAGCRGMRLGDAQISEKHCNFMINTGNATAKDLEDLGELARKKVKEKTGIQLEWEIHIIGEKL